MASSRVRTNPKPKPEKPEKLDRPRRIVAHKAVGKNLKLAKGSLVLGLESSCDESAAALYQTGLGLVRHAVRSQHSSHANYGGVVPELAARDHLRALLPLASEVLAGYRPDAIACTAGPGLAGGLATGLSLAQGLAMAWQIPLAPVNHLEGHLLSPFLDADASLSFPYLALLVSGGHTALYDVKASGTYVLLGTTLDDAVGEAFDKTAKLLGLPYPGGAHLEQFARSGNPDEAPLAPAMRHRNSLDFSFSGLKTAARRRLEEGCRPAAVAAAFEQAAVATLAAKTAAAMLRTGRKRLAVVGGVGCNQCLHRSLAAVAEQHQARLYRPAPEFCVDNAAMIALVGAQRLVRSLAAPIRPRWQPEEIQVPQNSQN